MTSARTTNTFSPGLLLGCDRDKRQKMVESEKGIKTTPLGLGGGRVWSGKNCGRTTTAQSKNWLNLTSLGLGGGLLCVVKRTQS